MRFFSDTGVMRFLSRTIIVNLISEKMPRDLYLPKMLGDFYQRGTSWPICHRSCLISDNLVSGFERRRFLIDILKHYDQNETRWKEFVAANCIAPLDPSELFPNDICILNEMNYP